MKIGKIMNMMKRGRRVVLYREGYEGDENGFTVTGEEKGTGPQWIGDGKAFYCIEGASFIGSAEEFYKLYDVKKQDEFYFKFRNLPSDELNFGDWSGEEVQPMRMTLGYRGDVFECFKWSRGALFVNAGFLEPFEKPQYRVKESKRLGIPYLVAYEEEIQVGVVLPMRFKAENIAGQELYDSLEDVQQEIWREMHLKGDQRDDDA